MMGTEENISEGTTPESRKCKPLESEGMDLAQLQESVFEEILAMAMFAFDQGKRISKETSEKLDALTKAYCAGEDITFSSLAELHNRLSETVAPAIPRSILYIRQREMERNDAPLIAGRIAHRVRMGLGPIPTIRHMVMASFLSLAFFIYFSVSGEINAENLDTSFLYRHGIDQIVIALFLLSAAAIGASFSNLYNAYQYVLKGTYNPDYNASYWIRFALGLTAGYALAELVSLDFAATLSRPLLALLGGFSASAVYTILNRLVDAVESIVQGDAKAQIAAREAENQAMMRAQDLARRARMTEAAAKTKRKLEEAGVPSSALDAAFDELMDVTFNG